MFGTQKQGKFEYQTGPSHRATRDRGGSTSHLPRQQEGLGLTFNRSEKHNSFSVINQFIYLEQKKAGFSPSMQHLVFWPPAGAWGAGVILPPCAQLLWCQLYVMKSIKKKKVNTKQAPTAVHDRNQRPRRKHFSP